MNLKIYAIIPARGGSKGVPGKNVKMLGDKPLIAHTILEAKRTGLIQKVIVNTDDEKIAAVAREYGAEVFDRPKELAEDLSEDLPVFVHHLKELKKAGDLPDMIVDLRATAPLRLAARIKEGIELLAKAGKGGADSVRAVSKAAKHPYKMWILEGGVITPFLPESVTGMKEPYNAPRQILPKIYQNNGSMNAFWPETVLEKNSMTGSKILGYVMEDWESVNIDSEIDFLLSEYLMQKYKDKFNN
jgi:N-acylneuraminate cytidylyltransferase